MGMGMDCGGWPAAASPRAPLAAVNGWQLTGAMQWDAAAGGASRKRGHEAAMGDHPSGGPGGQAWGRNWAVVSLLQTAAPGLVMLLGW